MARNLWRALLFLILYTLPHAAATLVQSKTATGSAVATYTISPTTNVTAGNTLILGVRVTNTAAITITSVSDNLGNTYTLRVGRINGNPNDATLWQYSADNITGGACTITVVISGIANCGLESYEVSGLNSAGSYDQSASVASGSGALSVGSVTPTVSDGFALAMVTNDGGKPTAGTGWTFFDPGNTYWYDGSEYRIITSTSTITGAFATATGGFTGVIVSYKAVSGGGGGGSAGGYRGLLHVGK